MAGMTLSRATARSSSQVALPPYGQAQVPPGSKLRLIVNSTWSQGSDHHSKTSVLQQLPFIHTHNPGMLEVGGRSANTREKKGGHLQRASLVFF